MPSRKRRVPTRRATSRIIDELYPGISQRSERGHKAREVGIRYEREVALALRPLYGGARRLFGQARDGDEAPDVGGTPFWVEVGKGSTVQIHQKLRQGLSDSSTSPSREYGGLPVLVFAKSKLVDLHMVAMERSQFLALLQELESLRRKVPK